MRKSVERRIIYLRVVNVNIVVAARNRFNDFDVDITLSIFFSFRLDILGFKIFVWLCFFLYDWKLS